MAMQFGIFDDSDFESQIKAEFLSEARELLEDAEPAFLAYEKNPEDPQAMAGIFRIVHTFKGSAGIAGFKELATFAHEFETLLSDLRSGVVLINPAIMDVLLRGNDSLKAFVEVLTKDANGTIDLVEIRHKISQAQSGALSTAPSRAAAPQAPIQAPAPQARVATPAPSPSPAAVHSAPAVAALPETQPHVLVVDDEPGIVDYLSYLMHEWGYRVTTAADGRQALDIVLKDTSIDLVVTDQNMPVMSGEELVAKLRSRKVAVPVIVVTACFDPKAIANFMSSGIYAYISKPFDESDLRIKVRNALKSSEFMKALNAGFAGAFRTYLRMSRRVGKCEVECQDCQETRREFKQILDLLSQSIKNFGVGT